jgi:hypothetical protein
MRKFAGLAAVLAMAAPGAVAAQDGTRQIVKIDPESLILLRIIDPVMGHGVVTIFYREPKAIGPQQGVHFMSRYVVANCDERTIRFGPDTYFNGDGAEIGERALSDQFASVQPGSVAADLLDVECLNKRAEATIPAWPEDRQVLGDYLEMMRGR